MNRIIRMFVLVMWGVGCAAGPAHAGLEGDVYKVSYVCYDLKGNQRWQATAEIRHKEGIVYTITERMNGVYAGYSKPISWVATTDFERTKDTVKPLNMDQHIFDESGRPIAVVTQDFNYVDKVVTCTHEDLVKKTVSKKEFSFSKDVVNRLLQGLCGQKFIETGRATQEIQVISPEPALYTIELRMIGGEEIEMNGRTRKAYKICFDPMLGLLNFVKVFLPKAYAWHSAEPVYEWLKYDGLECSVNSPEVVILSLDRTVTTSIPMPPDSTQ